MRRYPRLDKVQTGIVEGLRARGYTVLSLASIGGGAPDILVGWHAGEHLQLDVPRPLPTMCLFELKTPKKATKPVTKEKQDRFRAAWRGPLYQAKSLEECLAALQACEAALLF